MERVIPIQRIGQFWSDTEAAKRTLLRARNTHSDEREVKILFELLEKRTELGRSTMVCSQREPSSWPSMMLNDEVAANAITKRVTKHYTVVIHPR